MIPILLGLLAVTSAQNCEDLVDFCDALQPVCIGSIIQYQLQQLQVVADQISNRQISALLYLRWKAAYP
ncbi:hypothetical protein OESDEN_08853 [Oesophagostomum dentatum]|uniref:Uncharacterized protein n=1 Tax=Oesophagostomum dentatum TaxID=61180 RepID=A0A0B1T573_OESDE|nr:hypothetical protein OESDEN_08853 [Oesophagostomum dentatum]